MTLEELDQALEKLGLDLSNSSCMEARDMILSLHGQSILNSKKERCSHCWHREHGKCQTSCIFNNLSENPVEASRQYLFTQNNIHLFPFICMYFIPVYEKLTGDKDLVKNLRKEFKVMYKKHYGKDRTPISNI